MPAQFSRRGRWIRVFQIPYQRHVIPTYSDQPTIVRTESKFRNLCPVAFQYSGLGCGVTILEIPQVSRMTRAWDDQPALIRADEVHRPNQFATKLQRRAQFSV